MLLPIPHPGDRDMKMNDKVKKDAIRRLSIAEGHLKKVHKMLEDDAYCPDVIHQSQAVQAALKQIDKVVLHGHLHSCVFKDIHGSENEKIVKEIMTIFDKKI